MSIDAAPDMNVVSRHDFQKLANAGSTERLLLSESCKIVDLLLLRGKRHPDMNVVPLILMLFCVFASACSSNGGVFPLTEVQTTPAQEVSWLELPDGRAIATVHGDRQMGEHITFVRFPPGLRTAVHTHSNSYSGIVVKGLARHYQPASEAQADWLMSGSFYSVPGNIPHISECSQQSECVFAIHQHGAFDRAIAE